MFSVWMAVFAVVWLLSLFLEVFLTGRNDKLGLLLPVVSLLIPVGVLVHYIKAGNLNGETALFVLLAVVPAVGYFILYRFCLQKKREINANCK